MTVIRNKQTFNTQPGTSFSVGDANNNISYGLITTASIGSRNIISTPISFSRSVGSDNIVLGPSAGGGLLSSLNNNVFIGVQAGQVFAGANSVLMSATTGNGTSTANATLLGRLVGAGFNNTTFNNTGIGNIAFVFSTDTTCNNGTAVGTSTTVGNFNTSTALGQSATCTAANQIMLGVASAVVQFPGTSANGSAKFAGAIFPNTSRFTFSGSISGSIVASQGARGSAYKRVNIYCNALNGTATYTFGVAFAHTPAVIIDSNNVNVPKTIVTALSTTAVTITGNGSTTGVISLRGF